MILVLHGGDGAFLRSSRKGCHDIGLRHGSNSLDPKAVRIWLLGGFRVSVGSRTVEGDMWRRKAASLVKLLALAQGHTLHRRRVMDLLWPRLDAKSAVNNLHRVLHFARAALETTPTNGSSRYLALLGEWLELCPNGPLWVDVDAFEGAAATARHVRESAAYRAAVELYAGELLSEDLYEPWTQEKREELRRLYHALLVELAALHEEREEYEVAIQALRRAVAEEPAREEAHVDASVRSRRPAARGAPSVQAAPEGPLRGVWCRTRRGYPAPVRRDTGREVPGGSFAIRRQPIRGVVGLLAQQSARPLTSFVGQESALVEVKRSLSMTRLLTLTGAGGSGKTRLALEVARDLAGAYPDGVWLVELAQLTNPALAPQAVAAALDVREQPGHPFAQTLSDYLGSRQTLLVLDNCEHLVDDVARLGRRGERVRASQGPQRSRLHSRLRGGPGGDGVARRKPGPIQRAG